MDPIRWTRGLRMHLQAYAKGLMRPKWLMDSFDLSWAPSDLTIARGGDSLARRTTALCAGKYKPR